MQSLSGKIWQIHNTTVLHTAAEVAKVLTSTRLLDAEFAPLQLHKSTEAQKAAKRIWEAIHNKEIIYIFGDYDCDGVTSIVQLLRFCLRNNCSPIAHAPHRVHEGYGMQPATVQKILQSKASLVITVDTGISSAAEVASLQSAGVDVIITDHHHLPADLPPAYAIVHPEHSLEQTHWKPAGAGVVYNLLLALEEGKHWDGKEYDMILAMIGTVGDIVPLLSENRTIVLEGLAALKNTSGTPVHTLLQLLKKEVQHVTSIDIAFGVVPNINAAGRLSDATIAIKALLGDVQSMEQLLQLNTERKEVVHNTLVQVDTHVAKQQKHTPNLLWYNSDTLHHGILGLVAGRLTEQSGIPSIVATTNTDGTMSASLRSNSSYNITNGLTEHKHLLLRFGGHSQAAGCTFKATELMNLVQALHKHITANTTPELLRPVLHIDTAIAPTVIGDVLVEALEHLEPFGHKNEQPTMLVKHVQLFEPKWIGKDKNHIQALVHGMRVIGFNCEYLKDNEHNALHIAVRIQKSYWQGKERTELQLVDAKLA